LYLMPLQRGLLMNSLLSLRLSIRLSRFKMNSKSRHSNTGSNANYRALWTFSVFTVLCKLANLLSKCYTEIIHSHWLTWFAQKNTWLCLWYCLWAVVLAKNGKGVTKCSATKNRKSPLNGKCLLWRGVV
jgi:hypothetical protein